MADLELAQRVVDYLNELHKLDPEAITALVHARVPCNSGIAGHPSCQVTDDSRVGLLGLLNGLCGTFADASGPIASHYEGPGETGPITGFSVRKDPTGIEP